MIKNNVTLVNNLFPFLYDDTIEPPISFQELHEVSKMNSIHESAMQLLTDNIASGITFSNNLIKYKELVKAVHNFVIFGNCFFIIERNKFQQIVNVKSLPTLHSRFSRNLKFVYCTGLEKPNISVKDIVHIFKPSAEHSPYGVPEYQAAIKNIKRIWEAGKLRDDFYKNATNLSGMIINMVDKNSNLGSKESKSSIIKALSEATSNKKGSLMYMELKTNDSKMKIDDVFKFIPSGGDLFQKDDYHQMVATETTAVLAAHRIPAELLGIFKGQTPSNIDKIKLFVYEAAIMPVQKLFKTIIEEHLPIKVEFKNTFKELQN